MGCRRPAGPTGPTWAQNLRVFGPLDAFIELRTGLDRSTLDTGQADDTVLHILDPVAIFDDQLFRFGDPSSRLQDLKDPLDGLLSDEEAGTRYAERSADPLIR